jgi:hypothetical protein
VLRRLRVNILFMGDSDDSYDFLNLKKFVDKIEEGYDMVVEIVLKVELKKVLCLL